MFYVNQSICFSHIMNDSGIYDDGQMSRENSVTRMPSEPKTDLGSTNKESGMSGNIQQPFQRERSFVETNFVQTPKTSNITHILPAMGSGESSASTPGPGSGGKSSATGSPTLTQVILSDKMEEKITNVQLKRRKIGGMNNRKRRKNEVHIDHNYVTKSR